MQAVILAAGRGERLRPLTDKVPKPLIKVNDVSMIETVIKALNNYGVDDIFVVTGYLYSQFYYLQDKYGNVKITYNADHNIRNNISSLYAVSGLVNDDCFVCEADLYVANEDILCRKYDKSGYFGKFVSGHSDDWVFDLKNERISRIGKCGDNTYNMVGMSYFSKSDIRTIIDRLLNVYRNPAYYDKFWDEIVNECLDVLDLKIYDVDDNDIVEIDNMTELAEARNKYQKQGMG